MGIVNGRVLPAIEIVPKSGFYDYQSKYTAGQTEYVIPVPMDRDILLRAAEYTRRAARALGLRGAARLDYRVDPAGNVFFLEANTIPGMTETSLLPKAAKFDGLSFDDLVAGDPFRRGAGKVDDRVQAYHKTRPGKRGSAGRAVRKKEKARAGEPKPSRARLRADRVDRRRPARRGGSPAWRSPPPTRG